LEAGTVVLVPGSEVPVVLGWLAVDRVPVVAVGSALPVDEVPQATRSKVAESASATANAPRVRARKRHE